MLFFGKVSLSAGASPLRHQEELVKIVKEESQGDLILVLDSGGNHSRVQLLQQSVAESDISIKVLIGLEDGDHVIFSEVIEVLLKLSHEALNDRHVLNENVGSLSEDLKEAGTLVRGQNGQIVVLSEDALKATDQEIQRLKLVVIVANGIKDTNDGAEVAGHEGLLVLFSSSLFSLLLGTS